MRFKEINPKEFIGNPFSLIGDKWMLITCGDKEKYNTMTASWGAVGVMWNKDVVFSFVRPQRYTYEFLEKNEYFTISFYPDEYKSALNICGKLSGRDVDKVKKAGFTPVFSEEAPYFSESNIVLVCKKIYNQNIDKSCFLDDKMDSFYPNHDYHRMFIGEIKKVLIK